MAMTSKQFNAFLRMLTGSIKNALEETDPQKKDKLLKELLTDLQKTIET